MSFVPEHLDRWLEVPKETQHLEFKEAKNSFSLDRLYEYCVALANECGGHFIDEDRARNEKLADAMRRLRICEIRGSGIDRVVDSVEDWQLPAPEFRESENRTIAILYAHKEFAEMTKQERIRACYQHTVLRFVFNEVMNNSSLRRRFGLKGDKAERVSAIIRDTIEAGLIKSADPGGTSKKFARYLPIWA